MDVDGITRHTDSSDFVYIVNDSGQHQEIQKTWYKTDETAWMARINISKISVSAAASLFTFGSGDYMKSCHFHEKCLFSVWNKTNHVVRR